MLSAATLCSVFSLASPVVGQVAPPTIAAPAQGPLGPVTAGSSNNGSQGQSRTAADRDARTRGEREQDDRGIPAGTQDRLTEFQQLVRGTTGQPVVIFGANLFENVPTTFAPVDDAPVSPDYLIGPGDEVKLQVFGSINQTQSYIVDRTGNISIPQVGAVHLAGVHYAQAPDVIRAALGRVYRNFDLNVNLGQLRSIQIFVVGQARRPGSYTIGSLSTLLNALFASGGPLPSGSLRNIQVRRGNEVIVHFDLYDLLLRGDKSKDIALLPGDVIFIPPVGAQVAVVGSVNTPAIYELRGESTVNEAVQLSGGETTVATQSQLRIERIVDHQFRNVLDVTAQQAETLPLQNGDIISVASIIDRFKDAVTLRGNVANPGRYVWHPGMRITDLIPNRDSLITRNYYHKRNDLGQLAQDYGPEADSTAAAAGIQRNAGPTGIQEGTLNVRDQNGNSTAASTRGDSSGSAGGNSNSVGVALTAQNTLFNAKTDVVLSAPDINWSYAVIERQSAQDLTTSLIPFSLGGIVLNGDSTQNLELLPGDVVTIFSQADLRVPTELQTRFVRLEGEFNASGVYSVRKGETLRGLLARAGGFTTDAYLYASEFTRESTRRVEEQRLREYADELEAQVGAVTSGLQARALSDRDASAAAGSAADARTAVVRLRNIKPIGRIVLDLKPDSAGIAAIPDLALEDGDRFVVPRVPSNVTVEGQVYSANAFVYRPGLTVSQYLHLAGGPDRQADRRRSFLLRADGSVLSRQYGKFDKAIMFPGDTIVIPPQIDRRAILRNIVDLASIVGNLGLTFATIDILSKQ